MERIPSQARKILRLRVRQISTSSIHYCDYTHQCSLMISSQAHLSTCINPAFNQAASTRTPHNYRSRRFSTLQIAYSSLEGESQFSISIRKNRSLFPILKFTNQKRKRFSILLQGIFVIFGEGKKKKFSPPFFSRRKRERKKKISGKFLTRVCRQRGSR